MNRKTFKRLIRERMAQTGESYMHARAVILKEHGLDDTAKETR